MRSLLMMSEEYILQPARQCSSMIYSGVFEAIGNGRNSLIISLLRQFVITIPLSFILTRFFGPTGVWISFPVGELCASAAAFCLLKKYQNGAFSPL